jgi:large subunit ribosomal protein L9
VNIEVVLTENDPKLGQRGQVVKVSSGYAQNFLFPHNKAKPATPQNLKQFEQEKAKASKEASEHLAEAQRQAAIIRSWRLSLPVTVGEADKIFGSITSKDIQEALTGKGVVVERKKIHLEEPIRHLGVYEIPMRLHPEVNVVLTVEVVKKK